MLHFQLVLSNERNPLKNVYPFNCGDIVSVNNLTNKKNRNDKDMREIPFFTKSKQNWRRIRFYQLQALSSAKHHEPLLSLAPDSHVRSPALWSVSWFWSGPRSAWHSHTQSNHARVHFNHATVFRRTRVHLFWFASEFYCTFRPPQKN